MRVAFDMDGVLADLHGAYVRAARALYPSLDPTAIAAPSTAASPPDEDEADANGDATSAPAAALTRGQARAIWDRLCGTDNFWETLDEIEPGTVRRLAALAEERRWEVIFLTSRPYAPGQTLQRQTQRWLDRRGFSLPSVFIVPQERGRIASALGLDVVVDDRPEGCLDVVLESKARAILLWRGDAARIPGSAKRFGIGVVSSMAACLDVLTEADDAADSAGLVGRLKRLLGLKTRANP
jgi:hypothetical protein